MGWLLVFYIAGSGMGYSGTAPVESAADCFAAASERVAEYRAEHGEPTLISVMCLPGTGG